MHSSKLSITISKIVLGGLFLYFLYILSQAISTVNRRHISTKDGTYINSTRTTPQIKKLARILTKNCETKLCSTQNILDYVSNIPYKINNFQAHTPQQTIKENFGDCDDKSNLLISLLHELNIESYFVLVPHHIFVIIHLDENLHRKALYLNGKKYYILESTAKNSHIGFPLNYRLDEIDTIIEPFENRKIDIKNIEWR
ncbi:hypothetical protein MNB_SV-13-966 [hydrothermal vent metagenome]|uniref:Transglutaminase-like domain-containing protein n=1 Tax=hydrothermal vent metagenome TaxID=652676 RepID=A0A1W1D019_9ZZZZ